MVDINCPNCDALNSAEAASCWMCRALLKPEGEESSFGEDTPDWLSDLRGEPDRTGEPWEFESETPSEESPALDADVPDWLSRVRRRNQMGDETSPSEDIWSEEPQEASKREIPDWLLGVNGETDKESSALGSEWDSQHTQPTGEQPDHQSPGIPEPDEEDWFSSLTTDNEQSAPAASAFTFSDFSNEGEQTPEMSEGEPSPIDGEASVFEVPADDLPDWLSGDLTVSEKSSMLEQVPDDETLPDWLFKNDDLPPSVLLAGEDGSLPFNIVESRTEEELFSIEVEGQESHTDWFSELTSETNTVTANDGPTNNAQNEEATQEISVHESVQERSEEQVIDASGLFINNESAVVETQEGVSPFNAEELPDWLAEETFDFQPAESEEPIRAFILEEGEEIVEEEISQTLSAPNPFGEEGVPEWLNSDETIDMEPDESSDSQSGNIAPAHLPSWLEAMRPVEAVAPDSAHTMQDKHIEKAGPLAGLEGVLPTENSALAYNKPPVYSVRLKLTDKQRASAVMLDEVLTETRKPKEVRRETSSASQQLLRLLVAFVLIAAVLLGGLFADEPVDEFSSFDILSFNNQIEDIPNNAPVLLAVEYDPAYSGEMRMVGEGVMQRLLSKGARLAIISTMPTGPVLAEDMLASASGGTIPAERVVNLGYLAGGVISLQEFALQPQQAVRYGMDWMRTGQQAWGHPALDRVQQVEDFALVLVMTDSGDTGRLWVEQVQPFLGDTSLLMITTAQAAPIMQPYVASGQMDGMMSGVSGAMAYGRLTQNLTSVESSWNAYRAGLLVAVALIILGIVIQAILSLISRRKA
jgi:hypothetical protein